MGEAPPPSAELPDWLLWVWRAWQRLNVDRPWRGGGMGPAFPGRIAWPAVREWCEFHGRDGWEVEFLDTCLAEMDAVYIAWHTERTARP